MVQNVVSEPAPAMISGDPVHAASAALPMPTTTKVLMIAFNLNKASCLLCRRRRVVRRVRLHQYGTDLHGPPLSKPGSRGDGENNRRHGPRRLACLAAHSKHSRRHADTTHPARRSRGTTINHHHAR